MNDNTKQLLKALQVDRSPNDTVRAQMLGALIDFAREVKDDDLAREAKALMPAAHPFRPPSAWKEQYLDAFRSVASEDCGVDADADGERYAHEYWESLSDAERLERVRFVGMGLSDGEKDAENLNNA